MRAKQIEVIMNFHTCRKAPTGLQHHVLGVVFGGFFLFSPAMAEPITHEEVEELICSDKYGKQTYESETFAAIFADATLKPCGDVKSMSAETCEVTKRLVLHMTYRLWRAKNLQDVPAKALSAQVSLPKYGLEFSGQGYASTNLNAFFDNEAKPFGECLKGTCGDVVSFKSIGRDDAYRKWHDVISFAQCAYNIYDEGGSPKTTTISPAALYGAFFFQPRNSLFWKNACNANAVRYVTAHYIWWNMGMSYTKKSCFHGKNKIKKGAEF